MLSVFQKKVAGYAITIISATVLCVFIVVLIKLFGMFLDTFYYVLLPIAIAMIASYMIEPAVVLVSNKAKISKTKACIICIIFLLLFLLLVFGFGIPFLFTQGVQMYDSFPTLVENIGEYMTEHAPETKAIILSEIESFREKISTFKPKGDGKVLNQIISATKFASDEISTICSLIAALAVAPIYLYYMLISEFDFFPWLESKISFLNDDIRENILFFLRRFSEIMQSFFRGQLLIATIMGLMLGVGLFLSGIKFGFVLGFGAGLLNIVPYFGTIIGLGIIIPVAFFQAGGGILLVVVALAIFITVQLIEGYYLTPKIMGDKTGLHPTVIVFSVFFWGTALNGILGMIFAIPFSALIVAIYPKLHEFLVEFFESKKHIEKEE